MDENNVATEFNATVNEDEMIINIKEYEELNKKLEYYKCQANDQFNLRQRIRDENSELKLELEKSEKENTLMKQGIINFIKGLGG